MISLGDPAAGDWDFPRGIAGVGLLVSLGGERGTSPARLLDGTGLAESDLAEHERVVTAAQELRVIRNLVATSPKISGVEVGSRYHLGTFGVLGFALLTSPTVLDAMRVALRFIDLSFTFGIPSASIPGNEIVIDIDAARLPADLRRFLVERDAAAIHTVLGELRPGGVPLRRIAFDFPTPKTTAAYRKIFGLDPSFGAGHHTLVYDAAVLGDKLPQANPQSQALCESLCQEVVSRRRARTGLTQQVRTLVIQRLNRGVTMEDVAAALGMTSRTLRRRLSLENASFQELLDEVRESMAEELLVTGRLTVEDTALRLGYAEASSFIHAFKRWRGTTPAAFVSGVTSGE